MKIKHYFCLISLFCLTTLQLFAVPATPYPITKTQPDGTTITLYLHGDEYAHCMTDNEGWVVTQDIDGFFKYLNKDFSLSVQKVGKALINQHLNVKEWIKCEPVIEAQKKAIPKQKRLGGYPTQGNPVSLVILVGFEDCDFVTPNPKEAFERMLNEPGYSDNGATGSALDYFRASSQGQFSPQFDVCGPYILPGTIQEYGYNRWGGDANARQMIVDACAAAHADGIDFTKYDTDNDDIVDNVFVYYAGYNEAEGADENTVWPHRSIILESVVEGTITFNGKTIYDYACTSELKGNEGNTMAAIGTFCHEFGHVLGLPDYYHTQDVDKRTLLNWDIMDRGSYLNASRTPPVYSAYNRFYLGWLTPTELTTPRYLALEPITQADSLVDTSNQVFLVAETEHNLDGANPDPREFFMVEYRKKVGWDAYLPSEGVLFWHIDYHPRYWQANMVNDYRTTHNGETDHMRVYIEPRTSSKNYNPVPYTTGTFEPTLWNGTILGKPFSEINVMENKVYMTFMGGEPLGIPNIIDSLTIYYSTGFTLTWNKVWEEESVVNGYYVVVKNPEGVEVERTWTTDTTMTIAGLEYDTKYQYTVETAYKNNSYEVRQPSEERTYTTPKENKTLEVSYSPENNSLTIFKDNKDAVVDLYDVTGRRIYQITEQSNMVQLNLTTYSTGQPILLRCLKKTAKVVVP